MSGDGSSPRYEMVAGTRRRWSKWQKLEIVAEVDWPGGSVSQVARRHGLHSSLLFRWRRELGSPAAPSHNQVPQAFLPVTVGTSDQHHALPPVRPTTPVPNPPASPIEIIIAGGRTLRVAADVDTAALLRIVVALEPGR